MTNDNQILLHICESIQDHHSRICELYLVFLIAFAQSGVSPEVIASFAEGVRRSVPTLDASGDTIREHILELRNR